jgi:hypothetical protein
MTENPSSLYNPYTIAKRVYYLDELFGRVTTLPKWTQLKTNATVVFKDEITATSNWLYAQSDPNSIKHQGSIIDTTFLSSPKSLGIKSSAGSANGFSLWRYSWKPTNIEAGSDLVLKVRIRSIGLTPGGAYLSFVADKEGSNNPIFFYITNDKPILGTSEGIFKEYTINVRYFPTDVDLLTIGLVLDSKSVGTVYFDDIELIKYN